MKLMGKTSRSHRQEDDGTRNITGIVYLSVEETLAYHRL